MAGEVRRRSFVTLALDTRLPAPPAAVWPFISEPDHLNRWSTAAVHGIEPGDGGGFGTVGALREVALPAPLPTVTETVQYADSPSRFVYRVVGSRAVRYHHGELLLSGDGSGTRLRWQVRMAFAFPGVGALVCRSLGPQLEASVERLAAAVAGAPEVPVADTQLADEPDATVAAAARATADAQRALADDMEAAGDARRFFSRVYQYVTEAMIEACDRGDVAHAAWGLRLIPRFHRLYVRSLDGPPEAHWQEAFAAIEHAERESSSGALPFWRALVSGARAHIEGDLPRVLAATYVDHYADRCDFERFRADFLLLAGPLQRAWQRLSAEVPSRWFPPYLRVLDHLLPPEAVEHLTAKRFYDPLIARRTAFERGRALAAAGRTGQEPPAAWRA